MDETRNRGRIELTLRLRIVDNPTFCWVSRIVRKSTKDKQKLVIFANPNTYKRKIIVQNTANPD